VRMREQCVRGSFSSARKELEYVAKIDVGEDLKGCLQPFLSLSLTIFVQKLD